MEHLTDDQLLDLIDGLVTDEERLTFAAHITTCDDCKSRQQMFVSINSQLEAMPLLKPSIVFTERVLDQWDEVRLAVTVKKKHTQKTPFVFLGMMGAMLLSCFVILYLFSTPITVSLPVANAVKGLGAFTENELFWKLLLLGNAVLLLWLFNQRILQPFFKHRMAM